MKALYISLFLFLLPIPLTAGIIGEIEAGVIADDWDIFTSMLVGYSWQHLELYAGIDTVMEMEHPLNYYPFHAAYIVGAKIKIRNLYLKLERNCFHPIWSGNKLMEDTMYYDYGTIISIGYKWGRE